MKSDYSTQPNKWSGANKLTGYCENIDLGLDMQGLRIGTLCSWIVIWIA